MRARLWRYEISLASAVTAASQVHGARSHLFLELEVDGVVGFSEISPQPQGLNGDPSVDDVLVDMCAGIALSCQWAPKENAVFASHD